MFMRTVLVIFIIFTSFATVAMVRTKDATDTSVAPFSGSSKLVPQIHCPSAKVNNLPLVANPILIDFGGGPDQWQAQGGGGWAGGFMGAGFRPSCPADHPYACGFSDVWAGGALTQWGGVIFVMKCCATPSPPSSLQMKWQTTTPAGVCPPNT